MLRTIAVSCLAQLTLLAFLPGQAFAVVRSVVPDGSGGGLTIAAALAMSVRGDVVELASGTYFESDLTLADGVTLRSASGVPDDTVIDARGGGRVLSAVSVEAGTRLAGLTVTGGSVTPPCADPGMGSYCVAGALLLRDAAIDVSDCVFRGNHAADNGGAVASVLSAPRFSGCRFEDNSAAHGAAISFVSSRREGAAPVLERCTFLGNRADADAGAVYAYDSNPAIVRCTFRANRCGEQGSAIFWQSTDRAVLDHTLIVSGTGQSPLFCGIGAPDPMLSCCNVWNNAGGDWVGCLAGQAEAIGNFNADPLFCDPTGPGIHAASPCAPGTSCGTVGAGEVDCEGAELPPRDDDRSGRAHGHAPVPPSDNG